MAGLLWVSDREPGVRRLFAELIPEAEVLAPLELEARLAAGHRPDGLVIDGTHLLDLRDDLRLVVLGLERVLVCTGLALAGMPAGLVDGSGVVVLAKPFCVEDLEAALDWLRGVPTSVPVDLGASRGPRLPAGILAQRRRPRRPGGMTPAG